ncbi:polysaccharide biosynthesis/export family protein [Pseudoalteromonas piscicida]|uniref:Polysaccharide biosynthesis protein n=1 Tax=Pseudoalteromonas piscicida TaxID=43662 RepID=A0A2A5JW03_PSEO7|nr:SLBB domain-containing protein [Pseudoalteromonas piscicida]PCK33635.1 polysaccharide biosynthesis protein [Pseudoalteromonas piscicida]
MYFRRFLFVILMLSSFAFSVEAFNPTPEQIAQFQKLPRAQQEALAKQYGVDLSSLNNITNKSQSVTVPQEIERKPVKRVKKETAKSKLDPRKGELKPFGYDLFSVEPSDFITPVSTTVPNNYIIGTGDTISVNLYGKASASYILTVDNEGRLIIPEFAPVYVAGLSYSELKSLIENKIAEEAIGLNVYISMAQLRTLQIMVVGEAYQPGSYTISPLSKVTHALFASGGLKELASLRNIQVKRAGKTVSTLDLYDLLLDGDSRDDISLREGDVIFIPSVGPQIQVKGAVKREGIFELLPTDDKDKLIKMFGGFKGNAFTKRVHVQRIINGSKSVAISANFSDENVAFTPKGGDQYFVQTVSDEVMDSVTLIGAFTRPGTYQWHQDLTLDQLIDNLKTDLLPQADYNFGLIVREKSLLDQAEVLQFSPREALKDKNIKLSKGDEVYIFSRFESQEAEELALENLALTKEQKLQQEKVKLWHLFEYRNFREKVGAQKIESDTEDGTEKEIQEKALFSRSSLLKPLLKRLEYQLSLHGKAMTYEIQGQVRFPGVYPLAKNITIAKALAAAGGVLESANSELAEITRLKDVNSRFFEHIQLRLSEPSALTTRIQNEDTLNILMRPNWQENHKVHLEGEVRFPGTYTISRGETLKDVISRAGGLSEFAEAKAAIFTRESIKKQEQRQLQKLSDELRKDIASRSFQKSIGQNTSIGYEDMNKLLNDLVNVKALGRLVIDLPSVLNEDENVVLQDGDSLYIPGKQDSISIIGEVNYASSHLYKSGVTVDEYIELSGGLKDRAKEDQIYVIKANGAVFLPKSSSWFAVASNNILEPGDTIVVPMDASHMDNLTLWSTATQIFYQLGVGVAAIARI